jgi:hypothetical protein
MFGFKEIIDIAKKGILSFPVSKMGEEITFKGQAQTGIGRQVTSVKAGREQGVLTLPSGKQVPWIPANQIGWD